MVESQVKNPDRDPGRPTRRRGLELTVTQVAASALAAVLGAMLASGLGVYGTVIGAAVLSVVATTGGALFQHLFDSARRPTGSRTGDAEPERAPAGRDGRARRRWSPRRALLAAAGVFLLAMTAVTGIELVGGSSLAGWWGRDDGGTSVGRLLPGGGGDDSGDPDHPGGSGESGDSGGSGESGAPDDPGGAQGGGTGQDDGDSPSPSPGGDGGQDGGGDTGDGDTPPSGPSTGPSTGTETPGDGGDQDDGTGTPGPTPTPPAPSSPSSPGSGTGTPDGGAEGTTG